MSKIFGLPIITAILIAYLYPYYSLPLSRYSFFVLFLLMFWTSFSLDYKKLIFNKTLLLPLAIGLFLSFVGFPLLLYFISMFLLHDQKFIAGFFFSALNPLAIVAPFFVRAQDGDEEFSFLLMITSMIVAPLITPLMLKWVIDDIWRIDIFLLAKNMILLTAVPLVIGGVASKYLSNIRTFFVKTSTTLNAFLLAILTYSFFGVAFNRINWNYIGTKELIGLLILSFLQDFGLYILCKYIKLTPDPKIQKAIQISLALKNVAVSSALLLFFDPKASFASAICFLPHAIFWNYLLFPIKKSKDLSTTPATNGIFR